VNAHVGRQSGEALTPASADSEQKTVSERLSNDATDATEMLDGVDEQDEMHLRRVHLVVLVQVFRQRPLHLQHQKIRTNTNSYYYYYYYYYYYKSMRLEWHCRISCCRTTVQKYIQKRYKMR